MHNRSQAQWRGGYGFLCGDLMAPPLAVTALNDTLSPSQPFSLTFGVGYATKTMEGAAGGSSLLVAAEQSLFVPFGDDSVVISRVTITAARLPRAGVNVSWTEVWGQLKSTWRMNAISSSYVTNIVPVHDEHSHALRGLLGYSHNTACGGGGGGGGGGTPVPSYEDCKPRPTFVVSVRNQPSSSVATSATSLCGPHSSSNGPCDLCVPFDDAERIASRRESNPTMAVRTVVLLTPTAPSVELYFLSGYLPNDTVTVENYLDRYGSSPAAAASCITASQTAWKHYIDEWRLFAPAAGITDWASREVAWHAYNLRAGLTYDTFRNAHILNQGGNYLYNGGLQGAARDPVSHVMPFIYDVASGAAPYVKEILRYTLEESGADPRTGFPSGWIPWGQGAYGMDDSDGFWPSDLQNYVLLTASQYTLAQRDFLWLDDMIRVNATFPSPAVVSVSDALWDCFRFTRDAVGVGAHGLLTLLNVDHNDGLLFSLKPPNMTEAHLKGESVMNTALAVYVYEQYADVLNARGDVSRAAEVLEFRAKLLQALQDAWMGRWYKRVWLGSDTNGGWRGDAVDATLWTETQSWALLAGVAPERVGRLIEELQLQVREPSPVGALNTGNHNGTRDYAGIWWCGNLALMGGLARQGRSDLAFEEWYKGSFAKKAAEYPDIWFGIWSGPDVFASVMTAADPTLRGTPEHYAGSTRQMTISFPVFNMWAHSTPLYSVLSTVGTTFSATTLSFNLNSILELGSTMVGGSSLGLDRFLFNVSSPLVGISRTIEGVCGLQGWYAPIIPCEITLSLHLGTSASALACARLPHFVVNGEPEKFTFVEGVLRLTLQLLPLRNGGARGYWKADA